MSKVTSNTAVTFRLPAALLTRLQRIGDLDDRSVSYVIKRILQQSISAAEQASGIKSAK